MQPASLLFLEHVGDKTCVICLEESTHDGRKWIYHDTEGGKAHPYHLECCQEWFKRGCFLCPSCKVPVDPDILLGRFDRVRIFYNRNEHSIDTATFTALLACLCLQPLTRRSLYFILHSIANLFGYCTDAEEEELNETAAFTQYCIVMVLLGVICRYVNKIETGYQSS